MAEKEIAGAVYFRPLPPQLRAIDALAAELDRPRSWVIRLLVGEALAAREGPSVTLSPERVAALAEAAGPPPARVGSPVAVPAAGAVVSGRQVTTEPRPYGGPVPKGGRR